MKIESFEIKLWQYLSVVCSISHRTIVFNLKNHKSAITITKEKDRIFLYENTKRFDEIEADFDLTPIIEAWELANLEK